LISESAGSNATLFSTFIGRVISAVRAVTAAPSTSSHAVAGLRDPPHGRAEPQLGELRLRRDGIDQRTRARRELRARQRGEHLGRAPARQRGIISEAAAWRSGPLTIVLHIASSASRISGVTGRDAR
jgi:hypothetical protein